MTIPPLEAFTVDVAAPVLDDLNDRLRRTRWPADPNNDNWRFGVPRRYLEDLFRYWLDDYDWLAVQGEMNALPHFRTVVDGQPVHFVHVKGRGPAPVPLVLTHGFPWSFWDYRKVIGPLTDPAAHGGDPADAFDVVVPSVPGYGFSSPMRDIGVSARQTAALWVRLMRDVLGYRRFVTAGGDWGSVISIMLGYLFPEDVLGVYVTLANFGPALRNRFEPFELGDLDDEEREWYQREWRRKRRPGEPGGAIRGPQTAAYAGHDSPVALAAQIVNSRRQNSDCGGDVESVFTREELVTNVMLYWVTETWGSANRFYFHTARDPVVTDPSTVPYVSVPTGIGMFPGEVFYVPRKSVARDANLVHWTFMPRGGHFAACEQPDLFVDDLRAFWRPRRAEAIS
jgi:pimeloyl-ACP methyl ester carboxylesterase